MNAGIIYAYYRKATRELCYVGKTLSWGTPERVLRQRHRGHITSGVTPFDRVLSVDGEDAFDLQVLHCIEATSQHGLRETLRQLEREAIQTLRPIYNVKHQQPLRRYPTHYAAFRTVC